MNRQTTLLAVLGAVLIIALWWFFLYSPGQEELRAVEEEVAAAEAETVSLQQRVAALETVRARAPETEAAIAQLLGIVPDDPALPGALRQMSAAADDAGVTIDAVSTSRPALVDEPIGLYSAGVTVTATGSYFQLVDFLRRLEDPAITSRAILFSNLAVTSGEYPSLSISLTGEMYSVLDPVPTPEGEAAEIEAPSGDDPSPTATATEAAA